MGERTLRPEEMATTSTAIATVAPPLQEEPVEPVAVITLRPARTQQRERKKVVWTEDTVDNEHMNKKKSKCCCIYEKPHRFGESDSEDSEDECEHCFGHVERRARNRPPAAAAHTQDSAAPAQSASITLPPNESPPAPASPAPPAPPS